MSWPSGRRTARSAGVHLLLVSADPSLRDPASPASVRHAGYAAALAARRPGARLSVLAPGAPVPAGRFDAVTAQNPWSLCAWRIALAQRVPFLMQLHFDPFALDGAANRLRVALARLAASRAARVRVMQPATAAAVAQRWSVPSARIWVAPVPIALPEAPPAPRAALVVGAMRLSPDRSPADWIAAARAIAGKMPGVRCVLAGDGKLLAEARALAAGAPIDLPGALSPAALAALLARAQVFLHAAPHEAFGRAMAEAQAAGVPVVARRTAGAAAVIADGVGGVLADSHAALVEAAVALLSDPARAAAMGEAARAHAARHFAAPAMQARVIDFLLGERPAADPPP